jgi:hypothetical protein
MAHWFIYIPWFTSFHGLFWTTFLHVVFLPCIEISVAKDEILACSLHMHRTVLARMSSQQSPPLFQVVWLKK